jgi:Domain of unknown function (DUF4159)
MAEPGKKLPWEEKLLRSGFFIGAVLVHLVIFMLVAGYVIFRVPPPDPQADFTPRFYPSKPVPLPHPPNDSGSVSSATSVNVIVGAGDSPVAPPQPPVDKSIFVHPDDPSGTIDPHLMIGLHHPSPIASKGLSDQRLNDILKFELAHRDINKIRGKDPTGDYPVFVASYADGDWACNTQLDADGNIVAGSIPNLVAKIQEWTHRQINAHVVAKPLNIGGPELLDQEPPFIFFTGHKDFVLTEQEVENLQDYVERGGAIWGDNAEAGTGSRFDVAFRREMKRVIPSAEFEPLATDAEIFKGRFQFDHTPPGMNFICEPIEHMDLDGQVAILYTPNDYSDLYSMRILPGDEQIQGTLPTPDSPLTTSGLFLGHRGLYFRNFTLPSSLAVQQLGLNIVTYLVTRFDNELQLPP